MGHVGMKYSLFRAGNSSLGQRWKLWLWLSLPGWTSPGSPTATRSSPAWSWRAARLNLPAIVCSGGPWRQPCTITKPKSAFFSLFEAVGARKAGLSDDLEELDYMENQACPRAAAPLPGMFYCQLHELPLRSHRPIALPGNGNHSRRTRRPAEAGKARRNADHGTGKERY